MFRRQAGASGPKAASAGREKPASRVNGSASSSTVAYGSFTADWVCTVVDGEVTRHDLGAPSVSDVRLAVRVRVDGEGALGWSVALLEGGDGGRTATEVAAFGFDGDAEIKAPRAGAYRLMVRSPESQLHLMRDVDLELGTNHVELNLSLGMALVSGIAAEPGSEALPRLAFVWFGDDAWMGLLPVTGDAEGRAELPQVPAGDVTLRSFDPENAAPDPEVWPVVRELQVPAGGRVEVTLDDE